MTTHADHHDDDGPGRRDIASGRGLDELHALVEAGGALAESAAVEELRDELRRAAEAERLRAALTERERAWCAVYLRTLNQSEAARQAYNPTTPSSATSMGSEVAKRPHVRAYVRAELARHGLDPSEIVARIAARARFDVHDLFDAEGQLDLEQAMARRALHGLQSVSIRQTEHGRAVSVTLRDALPALRELAKIAGLTLPDPASHASEGVASERRMATVFEKCAVQINHHPPGAEAPDSSEPHKQR